MIEGEPTFPLTNCNPSALAQTLSAYSQAQYPRGIMANSQTHCMQLPHTYLFAHLAQGGTQATADLERFAAQVLPDCAQEIARGWSVVESSDVAALRAAAAAVRTLIGQTHRTGAGSGLLFGDADRFLSDLTDNLEIRAGMIVLREAIDAQRGVKDALRALLTSLLPYQQRVGFSDAYYGPLRDGLNEQVVRLGVPAIDAILKDFSNWHEPAVRNGVARRLFEALGQIVE